MREKSTYYRIRNRANIIRLTAEKLKNKRCNKNEKHWKRTEQELSESLSSESNFSEKAIIKARGVIKIRTTGKRK